MAQSCQDKGLGFVDAPVGRLASHADAGESLFMVGGTLEDFTRVKPLLEAMGNTIYHCGPCGSGTRTKIVNNFVAISLCQLNAEALTLSQKLGLDLDSTLDVLYGTTAVNGQLKIAWPAKVLGGRHGAGLHHRPGAQGSDPGDGSGECGQGFHAHGRGGARIL